ncbi:hypothetical protein AAFF_G00098610 [Aldrovandia affinis]|uniref:Uncharacterized protein n=1 Tax=Aldrovandia affinis TaxID=143900 RepID=A0AAD7WBE6_9TELE|nr:hypothetical protein AAFF_G00098610 [Aldrovandia affinis]
MYDVLNRGRMRGSGGWRSGQLHSHLSLPPLAPLHQQTGLSRLLIMPPLLCPLPCCAPDTLLMGCNGSLNLGKGGEATISGPAVAVDSTVVRVREGGFEGRGGGSEVIVSL